MEYLNKEQISNIISAWRIVMIQERNEKYAAAIIQAKIKNPWFDPTSCYQAMDGIIDMLDRPNIDKWLVNYPEAVSNPKRVGVVMAGNIPLVGFHDLIAVLVSGHLPMVKLSSDDQVLPMTLINFLAELDEDFAKRITIVPILKNFDAVIATGSDNTSKHFEYYFSKVPNIIRKNRVSVAVLDGSETEVQLKLLSHDILDYYGLGCRNVSKIFIPESMEFAKIFDAMQFWNERVLNHHKYLNNYDYNHSIYLLKSIPHLDNGFMVAAESEDLVSPISIVYYQKYKNLVEVNEYIKKHQEKIQIVVSDIKGLDAPTITIGNAQKPQLWDYADNVDTLDFLFKL